MIVIRGAITVEENSKERILEKTECLLKEIFEKNDVRIEEILSIQFSATRDLDAVYPAVAARNLGITEAALMCMQEMYVVGSLENCIRCAVFCEVEGKKQKDSISVYLGGAKCLRPDLTGREA